MKVAVASVDGTDVSPHFGRSRCFVVFTFQDGKVAAREVRANTCTAHVRRQCVDGAAEHHGQRHSHADIVGALRDCQVVLCAGMGWRAAQELEAAGIRPVVVQQAGTARELAEAFVSGKMKAQAPFCRCHG